MTDFEPNTMAGRIRKRLKKLGKTPAGASREATGKTDAIRKIFDKEEQSVPFNPRADTLAGLAKALGTTMAWLKEGTGPEEASDNETDGNGHYPVNDGGFPGIPEAGIVEAGAFRSVDAFYVPENAKRIPMQPDPRYAKARQLAWEVRGDSMTEAHIYEGTWVIAAVYEDYVRHYGDVPSGTFFIVQRSRYGGSEHEITVKEVRFYRDRFELVPHSLNPIHEVLTVPYNDQADTDEMKIELVAVVIGAYSAFGKR